jgi:hypothetical protein
VRLPTHTFWAFLTGPEATSVLCGWSRSFFHACCASSDLLYNCKCRRLMKTGQHLWVLPGIVVEQQCCIIFLEWRYHGISVLWSYADSNPNVGRASCFRQVLSKVLNKDTVALQVVGRVWGWYPSLIESHFSWHTNSGEDMAWKQDEAP